jgi:hypothetical protein
LPGPLSRPNQAGLPSCLLLFLRVARHYLLHLKQVPVHLFPPAVSGLIYSPSTVIILTHNINFVNMQTKINSLKMK